MTEKTATPQLHNNGKGFHFDFETPLFRSVVSVHFDFVLLALPVSFEMRFQPAQTGANLFLMHDDERGLDIVFGAPVMVGPGAGPCPLEGLLTVRFMQRLQSKPIDGTFEIIPK